MKNEIKKNLINNRIELTALFSELNSDSVDVLDHIFDYHLQKLEDINDDDIEEIHEFINSLNSDLDHLNKILNKNTFITKREGLKMKVKKPSEKQKRNTLDILHEEIVLEFTRHLNDLVEAVKKEEYALAELIKTSWHLAANRYSEILADQFGEDRKQFLDRIVGQFDEEFLKKMEI